MSTEFSGIIALYDDQPTVVGQKFNDRRLDLARYLAHQRRRNYTGVPSEERDVYIDVAGEMLKALDERLSSVLREVRASLADE